MIINNKYTCPVGHEENSVNFFNEIYEMFEYNRYGVNIESSDVVLDCGGNIGIFTNYALEMGASKVMSYECDSEMFSHFENNVKSNLVTPTLGYVDINNYTIEKILKQHNINHIDFAKIDIEGSEWDLFRDMSEDELMSVNKWAIEFHTHMYNVNISDEDKKTTLWRFLGILEKFTKNGFNIYYEHIHKSYDAIHLFAKKK